MNLRDYDDQDGKEVWLTQSEVEQLLEPTDSTEQRIALALGARCGLRSHEIVDVAPQDVVDSDAGRSPTSATRQRMRHLSTRASERSGGGSHRPRRRSRR